MNARGSKLQAISPTETFFTYLKAALLAGLGVLQTAPARAACDETAVPPGSEVAELATPLGSVCIELLRTAAPLHVDNFLHYLESGAMVGTFFHRSIPDFILSGLSLACLVFFGIEMQAIAERITLFDPLTPTYWIFGYGILLLSLEAARRTKEDGVAPDLLERIAGRLLKYDPANHELFVISLTRGSQNPL